MTTPEHHVDASEWFDPEFGEARRRYAELEYDPERKPVRAALKRVLSSITKTDHDLPAPAPVDKRLLDRIGPLRSKIKNAYEQVQSS